VIDRASMFSIPMIEERKIQKKTIPEQASQ
jgi:hypothetical protein